MTTESKVFFDKTAHLVTEGNIVYATDLNNPMTAIETGQTALINALQTGATIFTATDTGSVNAYAINPAAALTEYSDGQTVWLKPGATNTGASTINVSSLGAKNIMTTVRTALVGGELIAGYWAQLKYSSTLDAFVIVSERGKTDTETGKTIAGGTGIAVASTDDTITVSIEDGGVDTTQLADKAVTADKIADGTITQDKIAAFPDVASRDIIGGDITTSGQTITVSAFGCWDSTGTVWLETTGNSTWGVPATNNLEVYLFAVRATSGGAISVKGYSTYAGPASDGANVNAYRFLSWAENNGSGVLMPYRQVGDQLAWVDEAESPLLTASTSGSYVSKDVSAAIPNTLFTQLTIASTGTFNLGASYDGTNAVIQGLSVTGIEFVSTPAIYLKNGNGSSAVRFRAATLRR